MAIVNNNRYIYIVLFQHMHSGSHETKGLIWLLTSYHFICLHAAITSYWISFSLTGPYATFSIF